MDLIIDVREPHEFDEGHAKGAINIPLSKIEGSDYLAKIDKDAKILLYCNSGRRSGLAQDILRKKGFSKAVNAVNQRELESKHVKHK